MAKKISSFQTMTVRKVGGTEKLRITTLDSNDQWEIERRCRAEGFEIVDKSFGYKLYRGEAGVEDAMHDIAVFCRR